MPLLYLRHKNQARRLINLIDALYESRCKIVVSAEANPEDMFFPDAIEQAAEDNEAMMAAEALSDAVAAPFRPNVSTYAEQGDAARMMKRREKPAHPSEETTAAFKSLSIFTG
jgi:predicted ATPase